MLETYILKIDKNIERSDFDKLLGFVSEEKKKRINRFHRLEDAQMTLLGDVLVRYAICKRTETKNRNLVFGTNEYGKPILLEQYGIHFNISHSGNWVACAVDDNPVGIDVETIKPIDFKIAERFFSSYEYFLLMNQPIEKRLKYFYRIWTLKESYIKAEGKGLSIPLNSFSINVGKQNTNTFMCSKMKRYYFHQSLLDKSTIYAICSFSSNTNKTVNWSIERLLKETAACIYSNNFM